MPRRPATRCPHLRAGSDAVVAQYTEPVGLLIRKAGTASRPQHRRGAPPTATNIASGWRAAARPRSSVVILSTATPGFGIAAQRHQDKPAADHRHHAAADGHRCRSHRRHGHAIGKIMGADERDGNVAVIGHMPNLHIATCSARSLPAAPTKSSRIRASSSSRWTSPWPARQRAGGDEYPTRHRRQPETTPRASRAQGPLQPESKPVWRRRPVPGHLNRGCQTVHAAETGGTWDIQGALATGRQRLPAPRSVVRDQPVPGCHSADQRAGTGDANNVGFDTTGHKEGDAKGSQLGRHHERPPTWSMPTSTSGTLEESITAARPSSIRSTWRQRKTHHRPVRQQQAVGYASNIERPVLRPAAHAWRFFTHVPPLGRPRWAPPASRLFPQQ